MYSLHLNLKPPLFKANESRKNITGAPSLFSFRILDPGFWILDPSLDPDPYHQKSSLFSLAFPRLLLLTKRGHE